MFLKPHERKRATVPPAASSTPTTATPSSVPSAPTAVATAPSASSSSRPPALPLQRDSESVPIGTRNAPPPTNSDTTKTSLHGEQFAANVESGTQGTSVSARVNYFPVTLPRADELFVYSIKITSTNNPLREPTNAALRKDVITALLRQRPLLVDPITDVATDYNDTMVFVVNVDPLAAKTVTLPTRSSTLPQSFTVTFTRKHTLRESELVDFLQGRNGSFDCSAWLTALNIFTRHAAMSNTVKVGSDKFFPPQPSTSSQAALPNGLGARRGFFTSIRPVQGQVVMNMHGIAGAFINEQKLLSYVQAFYASFQPGSSTAALTAFDGRFKSLTKGLRVGLLYDPPTAGSGARSHVYLKSNAKCRIRRINGFGLSAATQMFNHNTHGNISVQKYFNEEVLRGILEFPNVLVCDLGTVNKPMYVPAELLYIEPNQPFLGKLPEAAMGKMLPFAQKTPLQNVTIIEDAFRSERMFDRDALMRNHLSVAPKMMETDARILKIPSLLYGDGKEEDGCESGAGARGTLRDGKWNLQNKKFHTSGTMRALGVIEINLKKLPLSTYKAVAAALIKYGITGPHPVVRAESPTTSKADLDTALKRLMASNDFADPKKNPYKCVLVLLPSTSTDNYDALKWWADTQVGINTICVTQEKFSQLLIPGFQANLALKFNVKSGGMNHILPLFERQLLHTPHGSQGTGQQSTMVVGADVTHPGQTAVRHCPSIAAVVASIDGFAVSFPGYLRLQRSKQEQIAGLSGMMVDCLMTWFNKHGFLPTSILFYRDGVSESQFAMVKNEELASIKEACGIVARKVPGLSSYRPKITLIVCGKRHHTRFFPSETKDDSAEFAIDHNRNFKPGLVVDDKKIRNPYHFDFFLQSHSALKGTARPCHYFVIHNSMNLDADQLQRITFNLCWTFSRSLTPISYASPAYCADVLAERARCYIAPLLNPAHPARPTEAALLAGFQLNRSSGVDPMRQKDIYVLGEVQRSMATMTGANEPHWVSTDQRSSPQTDKVGKNMFYT